MKRRAFALGFLLFAFGASAAETYPDCVVANVARTREGKRCEFDGMQAQIPGAYRACQEILIDIFTAPGADPGKVAAAVPGMRAEADARVTELLRGEIAACGYRGDVTVSGGGMRFSMSIIKTN